MGVKGIQRVVPMCVNRSEETFAEAMEAMEVDSGQVALLEWVSEWRWFRNIYSAVTLWYPSSNVGVLLRPRKMHATREKC